MTNEEIYECGFMQCEVGGNCDFCTKPVSAEDFFWLRTSYESIEGDYYCRLCVVRECSNAKAVSKYFESLLTTNHLPSMLESY